MRYKATMRRPHAGHENQAVAWYGRPRFKTGTCVVRWDYPDGHSGDGPWPYAWDEIVQTCGHGHAWDDAHMEQVCEPCWTGTCEHFHMGPLRTIPR